MTKKKAPADDAYDDDEPAEEDMVSTAPEDTEPPQPELTTTEPADGDTYKVGQDCTVKGQFYASGAVIVLTPEELESVQAVGIKIHPAE